MFFINISKSFNISRKPAFAHFGEHEKSQMTSFVIILNEAISWLLCQAKSWDCSGKNTPLSNLTRTSLATHGKKLTAKAELNCEIWNLRENAGKIQTLFVIGTALCAEKLTGPLLKKKETNDSFKRILNHVRKQQQQTKNKQKLKNNRLSSSVWGSNSRPWRYQHHALPTELTDQLLLCKL